MYGFSRKKGFTLIELLVVVSIISLLTSIILTSLSESKRRAQNSTRTSEIQQIKNALELYRSDNNGNYYYGSNPTTGIAGRVGSILTTPLVNGGYISAIPFDEELSGISTNYDYHYCNRGNALSSRCEAEDINTSLSGNQNDPSTYSLWFNVYSNGVRTPYCATSQGIYPESDEGDAGETACEQR